MKDVLKGNSSADGEASSVDASGLGLALTQQGQGQVRLFLLYFPLRKILKHSNETKL